MLKSVTSSVVFLFGCPVITDKRVHGYLKVGGASPRWMVRWRVITCSSYLNCMAVISRFILDLNMSLWVTLSTPAKIQVTFNAKYLLDCDQTDMTYNLENKKKESVSYNRRKKIPPISQKTPSKRFQIKTSRALGALPE